MESNILKAPVFRSFFTNPTVENVKILKHFIIEQTYTICCAGVENVVLTAVFTAIGDMNVRNKNEINRHLIDAVINIISHSKVKTLISMRTMLVILLNPFVTMSTQIDLSEELQFSIINCFEIIFRSITPDVIRNFYIKENLNLISQVLWISENILANEKYKPLRISAIKCIMSVFQVHDAADEGNTKQRQYVADVVFLLIPKIIMTLTNVAVGSNTLSETLKMHSIIALGRIICLIFEDHKIEGNMKDKTQDLFDISIVNESSVPENDKSVLPVQCSSFNERPNKIKYSERDERWLQMASIKMIGIFKKLEYLTNCKSEIIHQEISKFSILLLKKCQRNMTMCLPTLVEINVSVYRHSNEFMFYNERHIDILEECLLHQIIRLPRVISTGNEEQKGTYLSRLKYSMILLYKKGRLQVTLSNNEIIKKILDILLLVIELEKGDNLVEICGDVWHISDEIHSPFGNSKSPWKIYKHFQNQQIIKDIEEICKYLIKQQHVHVFVLEILFNMLMKNSDKCNEVLVLTQMLVSHPFEINSSCSSLHTLILENMLCEHRWNLVTDTIDLNSANINYNEDWSEQNKRDNETIGLRRKVDMISLKEIKNNILHTCLIIETTGFYAQQLQQLHNPTFNMKALHRIIEKLASKQYMIRVSAYYALETITLAFGKDTISDLMLLNADYLIHSINTSLVKPNFFETAILILKNTLHSGSISFQSATFLESIVSTLIFESSKTSQSTNSASFIYVFKLILSTIHDIVCKPLPIILCNDNAVRSMTKVRNHHNHFDVWLRTLKGDRTLKMDLCHNMNIANTQGNQNIVNSQHITKENEEQNSLLKRLATIILKRAIPLLTSKGMQLKLLTLDTINIGLDIIECDENELLPIVHLLWNTLIQQCFHQHDKVLLQYCLQVITKLTKYSKTFVSKRFTSDFLPHVNKLLRKTKQQIYSSEYAQDFKIVTKLLVELPTIIIYFDIREREFEVILDAGNQLRIQDQPIFREYYTHFFKTLSLFDLSSVQIKKT